MDFAVTVKGTEGARWVLAVDPAFSRLLMANENKTLEWVAMADCTFARAAGPDHPRPVIAVQPQPSQQLAVPKLIKRNHG